MKWSLEGKLVTGSIFLTLFLIGLFRLVSWQNATDLIELSQQIHQADVVLHGVTAINAAVADAEAGHLAYLRLDDKLALDRNSEALQRLEQNVQQLNQQSALPAELQDDVTTLQTLMRQRKDLAKQSIALHQADPTAAPQQLQLINQLNQNRLAMIAALAQIQEWEEDQLQSWRRRASDTAYHHLSLELLGTFLIFAVLLGTYGILYRQMVKRRNAESAQLQLAQEKAMSELKLNFFSLLSHEFRTPLSIILGAAQLLAAQDQTLSDEKRLKNLDRIQSSARAMNQLLNDILTLARAETGKLECHLTAVDLESFCLNLVEAIQLTTLPRRRIDFISQAKFAYAMLDETLLNYILSNILSNALKYSPSDASVSLTLQTEPDIVIFQVCDKGIGMSEDDQAHLYEPFRRGHTSGKTPGAGLGLAVVKRCVDLLQGQIFVTSQIGVGTTFTVQFPRDSSVTGDEAIYPNRPSRPKDSKRRIKYH